MTLKNLRIRLFAAGLLFSLPFFLRAHTVPMPSWVRGSASCTLDFQLRSRGWQGELSMTKADALAFCGGARWSPASCGARLAMLLKSGVLLNGQGPSAAIPLGLQDDEVRVLLAWPGEASKKFSLRLPLFESLGAPGWGRVFVFGGDSQATGPYFFSSDQDFSWPREGLGQVSLRFLKMGYTHILPEGLDHILFVIGLCLAASSLGSLLGQVTAFTLAHSLTLALAASGRLGLHSNIIEPLIAISIAWVALENLTRKDPPRWRWALVFCFGLLHGMGFAGALSESGLPQGAFVPALISFNLGVEAGQLTVVAAFLLALWAFRSRSWYRARVMVPASLLIAATGLFWSLQRVGLW